MAEKRSTVPWLKSGSTSKSKYWSNNANNARRMAEEEYETNDPLLMRKRMSDYNRDKSVPGTYANERERYMAGDDAWEAAQENRDGVNGYMSKRIQGMSDAEAERYASKTGNKELLKRILQQKMSDKTGGTPKWVSEGRKTYSSAMRKK